MLIFDMRAIGNKLLAIRKKTGLTQAEVAEAAGLSDRTYADIERGSVNMRTETILKICEALHITPDEILTETSSAEYKQNELFERLSLCYPKEKETALNLLEVYLQSLI
ncbi:MAG: helix-turn-helix transcriptional regulator [Oscillospiraceae bacterium]|nr:helix-turn-helix transcriptional regulator [Oscillospiraceae bacterium]